MYLSIEQQYEVLERFCEVESGTKANKPQLSAAIALARRTSATLLVAKLDRLSRSVAFIAALLEGKTLDFRVAVMPYADKFKLYIYAALAEQEQDYISKRTKAALQVAKARGAKLGGSRPQAEVRHAAVKATADANAARDFLAIKSYRLAGATYRQVSEHINQLKVSTARGGSWFTSTVGIMI